MSDKYAGERSDPQAPTCGTTKFTLTFDGKNLSAQGSKTYISFLAASGKPLNGKFDYSKQRQALKNEGPIPEGKYWIDPEEISANSWLNFRRSDAAWGTHRVTIHPFPTTKTHSRGGFFIHGGDNLGSAGCIDMASNMDRFVQAIQKEISNGGRCYIELNVIYPVL